MRKALYAIFATLVIAGYGYAGLTGAEMGMRKTGYAPSGGRGSTGPRAFWFGGYRGGK
jgi:hypothetical protein